MIVYFTIRGPISNRIDSSSLKLEIQKDTTLEEALVQLIASSPDVAREWDTPETISRETLILVNEQDVEILSGLDTILNSDDEVVILPLIHGG
jgi:molybdopterin converting factor small subunit